LYTRTDLYGRNKKLFLKSEQLPNLLRVENFRKYCQNRRERTQKKIKKLLNEGIKEIGCLDENQFFIAGVALYWTEGF